MNIISAHYGNVDCTEKIRSKIVGNRLIVRADNSIIGDPSVGTVKYLDVKFDDGTSIRVKEGELLIHPKTTAKKLAIFYSNNSKDLLHYIKLSLDSIKKAAGNDVDVLTCVWEKIEGNPFQEYIAWTKTSSHLNQLLQIMQLLYTAKTINNYEYVSFLEHDVLYPEGYFDYPEIASGEVITNMNYQGVCSGGWQSVPVKHEPFHQMTMRFDDAIKHCEGILENALVTNSGLIEPQIPKIVRRKWNCIHPAVHMNHGKHFTSHFSIYSTSNLREIDSYWGSYKDYMK